MEAEVINDIVRIANLGTNITVLLLVLALFLRGEIVSKSSLKAIVQEAVKETIERLERGQEKRPDPRN